MINTYINDVLCGYIARDFEERNGRPPRAGEITNVQIAGIKLDFDGYLSRRKEDQR